MNACTDITPELYKHCRKCHNVLLKTEFHKHHTTADRLSNKCKSCTRQQRMKIVDKNSWFKLQTSGVRSKAGYMMVISNPLVENLITLHTASDVRTHMNILNSSIAEGEFTLLWKIGSNSVDNLRLTVLHHLKNKYQKNTNWIMSYDKDHKTELSNIKFLSACYSAALEGKEFPDFSFFEYTYD